MAGAQHDAMTKTTPQQKQLPNVEPQQPRQQDKRPDFEPEDDTLVEELAPNSALFEDIGPSKALFEDLGRNAALCEDVGPSDACLSDLNSIDGYESPPHKQLKEHAAARRAAKKQAVAGTSPVEVRDGPASFIKPTEPEPTEEIPTKMTRLSMELVPCARQDAETATYIRQALQQQCGDDVAAAILGQHQQKVMRDRNGELQRYWVDATGATLRLAQPKNVAP
jgi:hypothetical protein